MPQDYKRQDYKPATRASATKRQDVEPPIGRLRAEGQYSGTHRHRNLADMAQRSKCVIGKSIRGRLISDFLEVVSTEGVRTRSTSVLY